jgi:hypothetical protein
MIWTLVQLWAALGLCVAAAVYVIIYNRGRLREGFRLREYGVPTTATVISVTVDDAGYLTRVRFRTAAGERYVETVLLSTRPEPGAQVDVTYDPQQPGLIAETGSPITRRRLWGNAVAIVVAALLVAAVLLWGVPATIETVRGHTT